MTQDQNEKALAAMIQGTLGKLKLRMSRLHHLDDGDIWEISEILASKLISLLESQSAPVGGEDCHNAGQVDWDSIDDAMEKYATTYRSSEFVEEGTDIRACVIAGGRWMKHLIKSTTQPQAYQPKPDGLQVPRLGIYEVEPVPTEPLAHLSRAQLQLGIMKNVEHLITKTPYLKDWWKHSSNWVRVQAIINGNTSKAGSTSSTEQCRFIGADPNGKTFDLPKPVTSSATSGGKE